MQNRNSSPIVRALRGSFKVPKDFDYKKELQKRREEKYLGGMTDDSRINS